jgi:hypothetical protein
VGSDVVFAAGRYAPEAVEGRRLLAHELTHVVQQQAAPVAIQRQPDPQSPVAPAAAPGNAPGGQSAPGGSSTTAPSSILAEDIVAEPGAVRKKVEEVYLRDGEAGTQAYVDRYQQAVTKEGEDLGQPEGIKPTQPVGGVPDDYSDRVNRLAIKRKVRDLLKSEFDGLKNEIRQFEEQFVGVMKEVTLGLMKDSEARTEKEATKLGIKTNTTMQSLAGSVKSHEMTNKEGIAGIKAAAADLIIKKKKMEKTAPKTDSLGLGIPQSGAYQRALKGPLDMKAYTKAKVEYNQARQAAERTYPILSWFTNDDSAMAQLASGQMVEMLGSKIDDVYRSINYVRDHLEEKKETLWTNDTVRGLASKGLAVAPGSVQQRVVFDKAKAVAEDAEFKKEVLDMAKTALGLLSLVPGGNVLALPGNLAIVAVELDDHLWEQAMAGSDVEKARALSQNEPSLVGLAIDILSVVADLGEAAGHFRRLASLRSGFIAAEQAGDQGAKAVLNTLKTEADAIKPGMGATLSAEASHAAATGGKTGKKVGAHTLLITDAKGGVLTDEQLSMGLFRDHPHHAAIEDSLRTLNCALEPAENLGNAAATATYVRVVGPEGKAFVRARIRYNPNIASAQDISHELTHIEHFASGRIKPLHEIDAAGDAAFFEGMKSKSVTELIEVAGKIPTAAAANPVMSGAQREIRRAVEEISTHLREIEDFGYTVAAGDTRLDPLKAGFVRGARNNIEEIYLKEIRVQLGKVPAEQRVELEAYVRNYVNSSYPELTSEFTLRMPGKSNFWARIGVPER